MALTQESILCFLLERGGKAKNSELLNNFRGEISCSDPAEKQHNRDLFKKLVNSVAVVKQIDGAKFVVVKKRYRDFVKDAANDASQKTDDSLSSQNTSFSYASPHRDTESARVIYSDIENNNLKDDVCYTANMNEIYRRDATRGSAGSVRERKPLSRSVSADTTTVKVLNISGDQASRARGSGAVFAVIAVKSPPRDPVAPAQSGLHPRERNTTPDKPITSLGKVSAPSVPALLPVCKKAAPRESQSWRSRHEEGVQPPSFPQVRPPNKATRQGDDGSESVPLEPLAHEWLVKCAAGLWGQIHSLLLKDTRLAQKKDFMSGFTALHWAAKDGNSEMIHKLVDVSRRRGACVDVNSKAHGGYTPLHIAAIHGRTEVMALLVQAYGASVSERDNHGKKASHYLGEGVPAEVRGLLGGQQQGKLGGRTGDGDDREQPKGLNTISKLFQPHMGKKQKTTKLAHDW